MPYSAPEYTHSPCLISPNLICIYYSIYSLFHSPHHSVPPVQPRISCYSIRWQWLSHRNTCKNITLDSSVSLWLYFPNLCFFILFFLLFCFPKHGLLLPLRSCLWTCGWRLLSVTELSEEINYLCDSRASRAFPRRRLPYSFSLWGLSATWGMLFFLGNELLVLLGNDASPVCV